jgi:hypothetical protein
VWARGEQGRTCTASRCFWLGGACSVGAASRLPTATYLRRFAAGRGDESEKRESGKAENGRGSEAGGDGRHRARGLAPEGVEGRVDQVAGLVLAGPLLSEPGIAVK